VAGEIGEHHLEIGFERAGDACPRSAGLGEAVDEHDRRPLSARCRVKLERSTSVGLIAKEGHRL
jgi:hypothetical protein